MIVLGNYHRNVGCSYHRVYLPIQYSRTLPSANTYATLHDGFQIPDSYYTNPKTVFFFNRVPSVDREKLLEARAKYGIKIVVDIDDHWILYPHHEMAAKWKEQGAHEQIQQWLMDADMVFVTNDRLKIAASNLNSNVHVVPNSIPFGYEQFRHGNFENSQTDFVYAGGSSHLHDLTLLKPVMKRLGSDLRFTAIGRVILAGYDHQYGVGNTDSVWPKMLSIVKQAVSYGTVPMRNIDQYMDLYDGRAVSLAPLERSTFNACKSNLKVLEAGCKGIPIIASYVEPYIQDIECPGVILCDTSRDWYEAIKRLLNDPELRRSLAEELKSYVMRKYHMKNTVRQREDLFLSLFK